uniref:Uncharacterized protein n=1 Tax=Coccidioides posadasii RMSCC 3488 TaxID=454284 RepID=A0A0J6F520_COCPO|nr:hypothetical protein CPAG_01594 [Coccidioides posadasii RMSCC 3488]
MAGRLAGFAARSRYLPKGRRGETAHDAGRGSQEHPTRKACQVLQLSVYPAPHSDLRCLYSYKATGSARVRTLQDLCSGPTEYIPGSTLSSPRNAVIFSKLEHEQQSDSLCPGLHTLLFLLLSSPLLLYSLSSLSLPPSSPPSSSSSLIVRQPSLSPSYRFQLNVYSSLFLLPSSPVDYLHGVPFNPILPPTFIGSRFLCRLPPGFPARQNHPSLATLY